MGCSGANSEASAVVAGAHHRDHHVGEDVDRVAQRRHLELDRHRPQLLDGAGTADVAPADERDGLVPPLDERPVHRVLEHRGVAVVVLAGEHDEALGPIERLPEPGDVVARVVATGPRRRGPVEEGERVVAQVDQLELELGAVRPDAGAPSR